MNDESKSCIRGCGAKTTEKSLICRLCQMKEIGSKKPSTTTEQEEMKNMSPVKFGEKKCECGVIFKPTGARQLMCTVCKVAGKKPTKKPTKEKSLKPEPPKQETLKHPTTDIRLLVAIDMTEYPDLHEWLSGLSRKEFRSTDMQVMALLNDCKEIDEKRITEG